MKKYYLILVVVLLSCKKEKFSIESLNGTWQQGNSETDIEVRQIQFYAISETLGDFSEMISYSPDGLEEGYTINSMPQNFGIEKDNKTIFFYEPFSTTKISNLKMEILSVSESQLKLNYINTQSTTNIENIKTFFKVE